MKELSKTVGEIAEKMKENGYEYFNIRDGGIGTDFKAGITSYLYNASIANKAVFPIYAGTGIAATSPDKPYSWATFKMVEDAQKGLRIDTMGISMYECYDGPLRISLELQIKSLEDIPSIKNAAKLIGEKWEKQQQENQKKWKVPEVITPPKSKSRKL